MAILTIHNGTKFGVGDTVRVHQRLGEADQTGKGSNTHIFEGVVIKIRGRQESKTFTVRRIGVQQVGIEKIFPLSSPLIEKVEVARSGYRGARRAKLYYTREKHKKEVELIYTRAKRKVSNGKKVNSSKKKKSK